MKGESLRKAERWYRSRRYGDVIRLLEPQVFRYRETFSFFFYLGMSCLRTGDYGGAYTYLMRGQQIRPKDIPTLLGLAAVSIKRREQEQALRLWLDVLDQEPGNRIARRALDSLRKLTDPDGVDLLAENDRLRRLLPPNRSPLFTPPRIAILVLLVAAGTAGMFVLPRVLSRFSGTPERPGAESVSLSGIPGDQLTLYGGTFRYVLDPAAIAEAFRKAKEYFNDYRDNMALRELNRIRYSNASPAVKEKAETIRAYLRVPTFATLRDSFPYEEVRKDPSLHEGVHVRWKGRISNLEIAPGYIAFDFLVGYEDEKVLQGIVPVRLDFAADLDPAFPLEVLGEVQVGEQGLRLRGVSIHMLVP